MKKHLFISCILLCTLSAATAQEPLYIVNGKCRSDIRSIPPELIESAEMLPADEETIALYGEGASHGVMLITLSHDRDAEFSHEQSFSDYIASRVEWNADEPAARVILRYIVTPEGNTTVDKILESTDGRLRRRVLKAVAEAPRWQPATKRGIPVESRGILRIELPEGKEQPRKPEYVFGQ